MHVNGKGAVFDRPMVLCAVFRYQLFENYTINITSTDDLSNVEVRIKLSVPCTITHDKIGRLNNFKCLQCWLEATCNWTETVHSSTITLISPNSIRFLWNIIFYIKCKVHKLSDMGNKLRRHFYSIGIYWSLHRTQQNGDGRDSHLSVLFHFFCPHNSLYTSEKKHLTLKRSPSLKKVKSYTHYLQHPLARQP